MESLQQIQRNISDACARVGRDENGVALIGASKTVEASRLADYFAAGLTDFGENYLQESLGKIAYFREHNLHATWHFIGALQSNKAREAVANFDLIHSVDRMSLAKALDKEARALDKVQRVLIQVNVGDEDSKAGVSPDKLGELLDKISGLQNLRVEGLMSLPPYDEDTEKTRPFHAKLRELNEKFGVRPELSMGMSRDYEIAIEEGATKIRIGTALFGARG